jgi:hypothetical protein
MSGPQTWPADIVSASRHDEIAALHASVAVAGVWPAHAVSIDVHAAGGIERSDVSAVRHASSADSHAADSA